MDPVRPFALVLAGGEGKRLWPLTIDRAKPAVPFGGNYRLIDFALSNLVNGGYLKIAVLTQYKSHSLDRHVAATWQLSTLFGNYVVPVPAQMRRGPRWFSGSADAIYQNLNLIDDERPGRDLRLRRRPRLPDRPAPDGRASISRPAPASPSPGCGCRSSRRRAFGVMESRARRPQHHRRSARSRSIPLGLPDDPDEVMASMGNYVFGAQALIDAVTADSKDDASTPRHRRATSSR